MRRRSIPASAKFSVFLKASATTNLISYSMKRRTISPPPSGFIFVGISTSGALGKYGARFFSNVGKFSTHIDDPYYPVNSDMYKNAVAIMLSVSGETEEILRLASQFSLHHCKIISITNNETSSLARLADFNLSYHVPQHLIGGHHNITTQIPVLYIIETIGKRLGHINSEK
ncbi:D-arabinose 5-phosphate isomerase [Serratia marcescens]|uniref:D-arabinose 5-phosphate isomerase n=1 Tax=Serratia marcescens TaxID=615 RepID=A0A379ZJ48_SERMA|nr:D-arabinose 5-phosphate isomerase [Serratia marcescens]